MARIEKTVFISYRRKDISWALAVYQYLTSQKYDVFFDFSSLSSGDFEEIIVSNIRARAHFVLILTPTALDRTDEPGDWLKREIEVAIDERRNIIPLFLDGFIFGLPSVAEKLTGKLSAIKRYNGLEIPAGYFMEAMERLRGRYLNVPLNAVIHPVSTEVRKVVKEEQVAADKALMQKQDDIQELVKPAEEIARGETEERARLAKEKEVMDRKAAGERSRKEIEERARKEREERERKLAEERASKIAEEKTRNDKESSERKAIDAQKKPRVENIVDQPVDIKVSSSVPAVKFFQHVNRPNLIRFTIGAIVLFAIVLSILVWGMSKITPYINPWIELIQNLISIANAPSGPFSGDLTATAAQQPLITTPTNIVPTSTSTPNPVIGSTRISSIDGMVIVYVPAGEFTMGSEDGGDDEKPVHTVSLDAYWIDQTEVTNAMYAVCVQDGGCNEPSDTTYFSDSNYASHPVVYVSWNDANNYCSWAGRELPSEAQWEKAASWNDLTKEKYVYPWGNDFSCTKGNFDDETQLDSYVVPGGENCDGFPRTSPVGSFTAGSSPYDALDMAGNVWEWVNDWYQGNYYATLGDSASNPQGPSTGDYRLLRGGAWLSDDNYVRSAYRGRSDPTNASGTIGFRCSRSP